MVDPSPKRVAALLCVPHAAGMHVRLAVAADLAAIVGIYNHYVAHSVATFDTELQTVEGKAAWFATLDATAPCYVCEFAGAVAGYAYYVPFRTRAAYNGTKEASVYVAHDAVGRGVGSALYTRLVAHAREQGVHSLLGVVGGDNPASAALHQRFGFELRGQLREVGFKFGRYVDTYYYEKLL